MVVYLLWSSDGDEKWIEEIFKEKIEAEALMRQMEAQDKLGGRSYQYWVQEKGVV
jgi:hypothetical protein